jgi:hypothetical protein
MISTPDTNFAAYLLTLDHLFTISVDASTGKARVIYSFDLTSEEYADAFTAYVNAPIQRFIEAQRRLKHVIRATLH